MSIVSIAPLSCISTFDSKKILLCLERLDICICFKADDSNIVVAISSRF